MNESENHVPPGVSPGGVLRFDRRSDDGLPTYDFATCAAFVPDGRSFFIGTSRGSSTA